MTLHVLLGRLGDIVSFLPVLHAEAKAGKPAALMVAKEFAPILEGCSYVKCIPFDGEVHELDKAMEKAHQLSSDVVSVQLAGPTDAVKRNTYDPHNRSGSVTDCFVRETWKLAGKLALWKEQPPVVFDQRDKEREKALMASVRKQRRRPILISLSGKTSPFPFGDVLRDLLRASRLGTRQEIVDISDVKAERFYDLVGLFEEARCLIASDSAPLHLAQAVPTMPVFALIKDEPTLWHGSPWRPNYLFHCRYKDFPSRWREMKSLIENIDACGSYFFPTHEKTRIIHVWNDSQRSERFPNAWLDEYVKENWIRCPAEKGMFGRDVIGYPFIKDMIRCACLRANETDLICISRGDIGFKSGLTEQLIENNPCFAHRSTLFEFGLQYHPATDLFAFTKAFWTAHSKELPELAMLPDKHWHRVMKEWLKLHGGKELPFAIFKGDEKEKTLSTSQNGKICDDWLKAHKILDTAPKVTSQLPGIQINRRAISPGAYNGSIIRWKDRTLLAYRWHRDKTASTALAMAELDGAFNVRSSKPIELTGKSLEDPRLWIHNGQLMVSYVESNWPANPPMCITRYGTLVEGSKVWEVQGQWKPDYGSNAWNGLEKNHVFFGWGKLHAIYSSEPEQVVLELEGHEVKAVHKSKFPHWAYGTVKGGVVAGMHNGKLLRFFHSRLDNEPRPDHWRYYVGAALMNPEPPLETVALSKEPILRGSELDDMSVDDRGAVVHWKSKVVFPMGVIQKDGAWLLSCGINDAACALITIKPEDLKL